MAKLYIFILIGNRFLLPDKAFLGRTSMWYVIQTETGKEEEALLLMVSSLDKRLCGRYMILDAEWPKRSGGQWLLLRKNMFPGYIFVETETAEQLFLQLKKIPKLTKILGDGSYEFVPLAEEEIQFLQKISKRAERKTQISEKQGQKMPENCLFVVHPSEIHVDQAGKIDVIRGPLKAFEREILRINLHKRYAVVKVEMLGEKTVLFGIVMGKDGAAVEKAKGKE